MSAQAITAENSTKTASSKMSKTPAPDRIMQLAWGYAPPLIIEAAVGLKLFDLLNESPGNIADMARRTGASERGLRAIMNALVGLNFLCREGENYNLTDESRVFLVSTSPQYRGSFFHHTVRHLLARWMNVSQAVRTGKPVVAVDQQDAGADFFAEFVESLFPMAYPAAKTLAEHLKIRGIAEPFSILDIGAGSGVWAVALAEESPHARIHAVDWPKVLEVTKKVAARHGLATRLTLGAGDLLEADFGTGHRIATIGHIFHSEGIERSKKLARRVYEALAPGGTVAIAEWIPNEERTAPPGPLLFAVNMLVHTTDGDTYTFSEMAGWLREAGFVNPRTLDVPAPWPLVLATKPG